MIDRQTHDRVVRQIAATRFPFPGQVNWPRDYRTITNEAQPRQSIPTAHGPAYPDIVVVDGTGRVREGGVVETEVTEALGEDWASFAPAFDDDTRSGARHFFVYVPEGLDAEALGLLTAHEVSFAGLRTYRVEGETITITPIVTPGDPQNHR